MDVICPDRVHFFACNSLPCQLIDSRNFFVQFQGTDPVVAQSLI